jgi:hypothetical protein
MGRFWKATRTAWDIVDVDVDVGVDVGSPCFRLVVVVGCSLALGASSR